MDDRVFSSLHGKTSDRLLVFFCRLSLFFGQPWTVPKSRSLQKVDRLKL
ncbi:MAG: hypothetical protein WBG66_20130 [Geitlerinemataceae cyanobacterium]